jgi:hypothetical protein
LDRLRAVASSGEEGRSFKLREMWAAGDGDREGESIGQALAGQTVILDLGPEEGRPVKAMLYKTSSGSEEKEFMASGPARRIRLEGREASLPKGRELPKEALGRSFQSGWGRKAAPAIWWWLDRASALADILPLKPIKVILDLSPANAREAVRLAKRQKRDFPDIVWSLSPIMFRKAQEKARQEIAALASQGAREFMVSNLGQIGWLKEIRPDFRLWGDYRLGVLNSLSYNCLASLGLSGLALSPEIDEATYAAISKSSLAGRSLVYLSGRPALFTSRLKPLGLKKGPILSLRGERYWAGEEGEAFVLTPENRIFVGGLLKVPPPPNLAAFIADLRREPSPAIACKGIARAVREGKSLSGAAFNFKRGLV